MSTCRLPPCRSRRGSLLTLACLALACLALAGCGGRSGPPGTVPVAGMVTHAGKPLPNGSVHFSPASGGAGGGAGRLAAGRYLVHLAPGHYRVAVISTEGFEQIDTKTGRILPGKPRIPERFMTPETSGLKATVAPENSRVDLVLGP
jgi:hypothetical protein